MLNTNLQSVAVILIKNITEYCTLLLCSYFVVMRLGQLPVPVLKNKLFNCVKYVFILFFRIFIKVKNHVSKNVLCQNVCFNNSGCHYSVPVRGTEYCDENVCLFVCLRTCLRNHTFVLHIFYTYFLWPWPSFVREWGTSLLQPVCDVCRIQLMLNTVRHVVFVCLSGVVRSWA